MTYIIIAVVAVVGGFVAGILVGRKHAAAVATTIKTVNTVASDVNAAANAVKAAVK